MADQKTIDLTKQLSVLEEELKTKIKERVAAAKEYNDLLGIEFDQTRKELEAQTELADAYDERLKFLLKTGAEHDALLEKLNSELDTIAKKAKKDGEITEEATKRKAEIETIQRSQEEILRMTEDELAAEKGITAEKIKRVRLQQAIATQTDVVGGKLATAANSMFGIADASGQLTSEMGKLVGMGGSWRDGIKAAAKEFFSAKNRVNMFAAGAQKAKESIFALGAMMLKMVGSLDKAQVGFRTATGAGREWDDRILSQWENTKHLNNTLEDTVRANQSLYEGFSGFANMSDKATGELAGFVSEMERFGVEASTSTELLQSMTRTFGFTTEQAKDAEKTFYGFGKVIGVTTKKMMSDWNANAASLASYGKKSKDMFTKTAATARALGMEVSNLLKISEGFDTFEGAADKVGNLNALLGGPYLNSLEMLEEHDPVERARMLEQAIKQSGQSWGTMGRYMKIATAQAAGMPLEDLSKIMENGVPTAEKYAETQAKAAEEAKKMADEAKANSDMGRQWARILNDLSAALMPMVEGFRGFVQTIADLGLTSKPVMYTLIGIWGAMKLLQFWAAMAAAKTTVLNLVTGTSPAVDVPAAAGKGFLAKMTAALAASSTAAVGPILAVGAAIIMGGIAVAIIVLSLAALALAMKGLGANGLTMLGVMILLGVAFAYGAGAIKAFGIASAAAAPGIAAVAWPLFMIAGGAALVGLAFAAIGYAIAAIIDSIVGLIALLIENHEVVLKVAGALSIMAIAAVVLAVAGFFAAGALVAMAVGVGLLAVALWMISTEDLQAMGDIFKGMGNITYATVGAVYMMVDAIKEMAEAADDIEFNDSKFEAIRKTVDAMASTKGLNAKVLAATTHTIRAMSDLTRSSAEARVEPMQMAVNLIKEIKGGEGATSGAGAGSTAGGGQTIVIELNERELGRAVNAVLSNQYNLAKLT